MKKRIEWDGTIELMKLNALYHLSRSTYSIQE